MKARAILTKWPLIAVLSATVTNTGRGQDDAAAPTPPASSGGVTPPSPEPSQAPPSSIKDPAIPAPGNRPTSPQTDTDAAMAAPLTYGSLKFETDMFDFGEVYRGTQLSHRFKFVNAGPGPLVIQGVHAACGCTAAEVDKGRRYLQSEGGFVEVKLDTTDFSGPMLKTVTIMSNEKLLPDRTLTLKATVKMEVEADPPLLDFSDVRSQTGATKVFKIKAVGASPVKIKDLSYNHGIVAAKIEPDGNDWRVTVQLLPGLPAGFLKDQLIVHNNSAHLKELPVPIRANVLGNIDFTPAYLEFGAISPSETVSRSVTMRGASPFEITGTKTDLVLNGRHLDDSARYVKITNLPHEQGKRLITIDLQNAAKLSGSVHGKITFATTDAQQKQVVVDFYAFFR